MATDSNNVDADDANNAGGDIREVPVCLHCLQPVAFWYNYCPHCSRSVGQVTEYLPYEGIWFNAWMWAKLWNRLWYRDIDSPGRKCFFFLIIPIGSPMLLLALPTVWWWKSRQTAAPTNSDDNVATKEE